MILTLTVLRGQASVERYEVTMARSTVLIGRGTTCDVRVDDSYVSDTHAAVYLDAAGARLRDLGSHSGTWVNGQALPQEDVALRHGDQVQIGQTLFGVEVREEEGAVAAEVPDDALSALVATMQTTPRDCARFVLRAETAPLYALVDLAADPELLEMLNESGEMFCALDETVEPDALGETAPCLVKFSSGPFLGEFIEAVWGNGWAVFFTSEAPFEEVYAHWLKWVEYSDDGEVTSPRLWEPTQLAEVLGGMQGAEAGEFWGPAERFLVEDKDGGALMCRDAHPRGASQVRVSLTPSTA